jgi:CheY-like chemotaxis protein
LNLLRRNSGGGSNSSGNQAPALEPLRKHELTVLVVDDNRSDLTVALRALERYGISRTMTAQTGEAALEKMDSRDVDIAIIDYVLPHMSGLELLQAIRRHFPRTVVMMMTGARDERVAADAIKLGAVEYISKDDFTTSAIMSAMQRCLREREKRRTQEMSAATPSDHAEAFETEIRWLLDYYMAAQMGVGVRLAPQVQYEWGEARDALGYYLRRSIELFPEIPEREESHLIEILFNQGASPREVVQLFADGFRALFNSEQYDASVLTFRPNLLLTRLMIRLLMEYQTSGSMAAFEQYGNYPAR